MGSLFLISQTLLPLKGSGKEHTYPSNSRCGGNRAFLSFFFPRFLFHGEYVILFIEGVDLATLHYDRRVFLECWRTKANNVPRTKRPVTFFPSDSRLQIEFLPTMRHGKLRVHF